MDSLLEENPSAAERAYDAITDSISRLATFPEMSRRGRRRGTRAEAYMRESFDEARQDSHHWGGAHGLWRPLPHPGSCVQPYALAAEACRAAMEEAGLATAEVDSCRV